MKYETLTTGYSKGGDEFRNLNTNGAWFTIGEIMPKGHHIEFCRQQGWEFRRPISAKKTRMMKAKELAGKFVDYREYCGLLSLVTGFRKGCDQFVKFGDFEKEIERHWLFTTTPEDDSSWKSVMIEEEG